MYNVTSYSTSTWTGCQTCLIFWRSWVQILALHWRCISWRFTFKIQVVNAFTVRFDSTTPAFCRLCLCVPYDVHCKQLLFPIQHSETGVHNGSTLCSQLCKNWIFLACVTYINFSLQRLRIIFTNSEWDNWASKGVAVKWCYMKWSNVLEKL